MDGHGYIQDIAYMKMDGHGYIQDIARPHDNGGTAPAGSSSQPRAPALASQEPQLQPAKNPSSSQPRGQ